MNWTAILLNAAIFGIAVIFIYRKLYDTLRLKACYRMYAVRDEFVYLVASGTLKEEGSVFGYYYKRINSLLAEAPNVGLDDMLHTIFVQWDKNKDFNKMLKDAEEKASRLFKDPAFEDPDVRRAVANYYRAVEHVILAHSSILRGIYYIIFGSHARKLNNWAVTAAAISTALVRPKYKRAIDAVEYAQREANVLSSPI